MRDDFPEETKRAIAHRANLTCSNPKCGATTAGPQKDPTKALNIGVAAHISAASQGGPRYSLELTTEQRKSAENGIWLCQNCAKIVDNDESLYTEKILLAWKTIREFEAFNSIGQTKPSIHETESQRKLRELANWKDKRIMLVKMANPQQVTMLGVRPWEPNAVVLLDCTEFYVQVKGDGWDNSRSIPMRNVEIGFDDRHHCVELLEYDR